MKVLVYDDKLFFDRERELAKVNADHSVVADAMMFDLSKQVTAAPDEYVTEEDLNEFREALGLEKKLVVEETEAEEENEEENEEDDDNVRF